MRKEHLNDIATRGVEAVFADEPPVYNGAREYYAYENNVRTERVEGVAVSAAYLGGEFVVKIPGKSLADLEKFTKGKTRIAFDGLHANVWTRRDQAFSDVSLTADSIREVK